MATVSNYAEQAPDEVQSLFYEYQAAQAELKAAKERAEASAAQLKLALEDMRDAQGLDPDTTRPIFRGPDFAVSLTPVHSMRLDTKALKAQQPVLYASLCHPSVSFRLTTEANT